VGDSVQSGGRAEGREPKSPNPGSSYQLFTAGALREAVVDGGDRRSGSLTSGAQGLRHPGELSPKRDNFRERH
jgi:hypothetical protein